MRGMDLLNAEEIECNRIETQGTARIAMVPIQKKAINKMPLNTKKFSIIILFLFIN